VEEYLRVLVASKFKAPGVRDRRSKLGRRSGRSCLQEQLQERSCWSGVTDIVVRLFNGCGAGAESRLVSSLFETNWMLYSIAVEQAQAQALAQFSCCPLFHSKQHVR
jgi:hypothetical protein